MITEDRITRVMIRVRERKRGNIPPCNLGYLADKLIRDRCV